MKSECEGTCSVRSEGVMVLGRMRVKAHLRQLLRVSNGCLRTLLEPVQEAGGEDFMEALVRDGQKGDRVEGGEKAEESRVLLPRPARGNVLDTVNVKLVVLWVVIEAAVVGDRENRLKDRGKGGVGVSWEGVQRPATAAQVQVVEEEEATFRVGAACSPLLGLTLHDLLDLVNDGTLEFLCRQRLGDEETSEWRAGVEEMLEEEEE